MSCKAALFPGSHVHSMWLLHPDVTQHALLIIYIKILLIKHVKSSCRPAVKTFSPTLDRTWRDITHLTALNAEGRQTC